ncbi:uncharacterized protein K02A2.6-like [Dendronephthya gigantea]|uniref:uncharacterized protein K02A2.6-like n=1 Tax=Dendronephthya gigantea TaxID=151771 RepID=UPI00106937E1|nr:uncharacterized protein K02A2.6-like [Dendronephthya gigantea]
MGIESCLRRARECLYWPGMNSEVKAYVQQCETCRAFDSKQSKEPLHPHDPPERPCSKVGVDIFTFNGRDYLLTVDYFSSYWEIDLLEGTKSKAVIRKLKAQFARFGIPDVVMTDNGPQLSSKEFENFGKLWKFEHVTSSPRYPQSNGKVERAIRDAKQLMKKAKKTGSDPYLALLRYRNTPTQSLGSSPVQRLMSRRTKSLLPTTKALLRPKVVNNVIKKIKARQLRAKKYYDRGTRGLTELKRGETVRIVSASQERTGAQKAKIQRKVGIRSYEVVTEGGKVYCRNRRHLRKTNEPLMGREVDVRGQDDQEPLIVTGQCRPLEGLDRVEPRQDRAEEVMRRTRSGRSIKLPERFRDFEMN